MSRITGTDARSLMEAYNAVYTPQINEEQVWEEVETWVNSLVEEGYDLSEYSWEDMYENYLNEYAGGGVPGSGGAVTMYSRPLSNSSTVQSRFARPMNAGTPQTYGGGRSQSVTVRPPVASLPSSARQVTQYPQGVSTGVGGGNAGASRQAPATRPSAPAPAATRPSAPAATRPSAPAAARPPAATTGNPPLKPPTLPPVPGRESLASQAAELRAMQAASRQRQGLTQSFDPFDVVLGHLIDEGYADTNEAALAIMANMSEEWKEDILDESVLGARKGHIRSVIGKGGSSIKYVASGGDIVANDNAAQERASAADRTRDGKNRANAARASQASKKSIKRLNSKPGEDEGDYDSGYYGDDDTSDGKRHYSLSHTNRGARKRRASGR